ATAPSRSLCWATVRCGYRPGPLPRKWPPWKKRSGNFCSNKKQAPALRRVPVGLYGNVRGSDDALAHHGRGDLQEARDVGAGHQVALAAVFLGSIGSSLVDVDHDVVQTLVHFLEGPAQAQGVLAHFQAGSSDTAGVGSLGR